MKNADDFLNGLRQERKTLEHAVSAADLAGARAQVETARAALQGWRTRYGEAISRRGYLEREAMEETKLESAAEVARELVVGFEYSQRQATDRIREIDAYLNAGTNLTTARKAHADAAAEAKRIQALEDQLDQIIASYRDEIASLTEKQRHAASLRVDADVEARVAGKPATATRPLAPVDAELASRQEALAAAERKRDAVQASSGEAIESLNAARGSHRAAAARSAELAYYEALPAFLPIIARLIAHGSGLGGGNVKNLFCIRCDPDLVRAAADEIELEMSGAPSQQKALA